MSASYRNGGEREQRRARLPGLGAAAAVRGGDGGGLLLGAEQQRAAAAGGGHGARVVLRLVHGGVHR